MRGFLVFVPGSPRRTTSIPLLSGVALLPTAAQLGRQSLRFDPPVTSLERITNEPVELGGKQIDALQRVRWFIASGNRDPKRFAEPDTFDITRSPNPHLGFGNGIHLCPGATLARLEAQETFKAMADGFGELTIETDPLEWSQPANLRSLKALAVSWEPKKH